MTDKKIKDFTKGIEEIAKLHPADQEKVFQMENMRTYEQDLKELNISEGEFNNIISHIYDKTADEMAVLAKAIKSGAAVLPTVKRAFERVLAIRQAERQEAYNIYYNDLNTMCYSCKKCGISCNGTICKTWTGCAMKN